MTYLMDTSEEGRRVELKTDRTLTLDQLRWAGVGEGMRVMDLGCAAGTTCRIIAGQVGESGRVVGIDASASRLEQGQSHREHRPNIEYRQGDAARAPASDGEFDASWSRFLFEYLPQPERALAEMIRVTRPGGIVCVSDIDGNCVWHYPCGPALRGEIDEALRTLGNGFNPGVGISLFTMCVDAGLQDVAVDVRPYHVIAGAIDAERKEHWRMKLEGVTEGLRERGWPNRRAIALAEAFMGHLCDHRTFTYSVLLSVRGSVRCAIRT